MSETKNYLLRKTLQPQGAYRQQMHERDSRHIQSEILFSELGTIIEVAQLTPEEVEDRRSDARPHVLSVEPDEEAHAMGFASAQAADNMTPDAIKRALGVDKCHEVGIKGAGQKSAVIDSGMGTSFAEKYASSIIEYRDYTGEGWQSPDDTHGEWCASAVLMIAPESRVGVYKALSGSSGSGSYSGIIRAVNDAVAAGYTGITLSLGGPKNDALNAAVNAAEAKGVHTTSAAGNEQRNSSAMTANNKSPASAKDGTTCGAKKSDGFTSDFSNWGDVVDVGCYGENVQAPDTAGWWDGTSMSTPLVQGILNLSRSSGATKDEAKKRLYGSCRKTGEPAYKEGYGVVDAWGAVRPEPSNPPVKEPIEPPAPTPPATIKKLSHSALKDVGTPVSQPYEVTLRRNRVTRTLGFIYPERR